MNEFKEISKRNKTNEILPMTLHRIDSALNGAGFDDDEFTKTISKHNDGYIFDIVHAEFNETWVASKKGKPIVLTIKQWVRRLDKLEINYKIIG